MIVTKRDNHWEFRPAPSQVRNLLILSLVATVICSAISVAVLWGWLSQKRNFDDGWELMGCLCLAVVFLGGTAGGVFSGGRAWLFRATPLIVESTGRVYYDGMLLGEAGTVRAVVLEHHSKEEGADDHKVSLHLTGGARGALPEPYFYDFGSKNLAAAEFAKQLAECFGCMWKSSRYRSYSRNADQLEPVEIVMCPAIASQFIPPGSSRCSPFPQSALAIRSATSP